MTDDPTQLLDMLADTPVWEWPETARTQVLTSLRSDDAALRLKAAAVASEIVDDEIAEALLQLVEKDGSEAVAQRAAIALGPALESCDLSEPHWPDNPLSDSLFQDVIARLEAVFADPSKPLDTRRRVLESAVRAPREWQREAVRVAYESDDVSWRTSAVFCMAFLPGFDEQIVEALSDDEVPIRYEAVRAAAERELNQAGSVVLDLASAEDTNSDLRLAAIETLGALQPEGSEELLETLADSKDDAVAGAAQVAIDERLVVASAAYDRVQLPDDDEEDQK